MDVVISGICFGRLAYIFFFSRHHQDVLSTLLGRVSFYLELVTLERKRERIEMRQQDVAYTWLADSIKSR